MRNDVRVSLCFAALHPTQSDHHLLPAPPPLLPHSPPPQRQVTTGQSIVCIMICWGCALLHLLHPPPPPSPPPLPKPLLQLPPPPPSPHFQPPHPTPLFFPILRDGSLTGHTRKMFASALYHVCARLLFLNFVMFWPMKNFLHKEGKELYKGSSNCTRCSPIFVIFR